MSTKNLYARVGQFQWRLFQANHNAHVALWELGSGNVADSLSHLVPLITELEALATECQAIVALYRQDGGAA